MLSAQVKIYKLDSTRRSARACAEPFLFARTCFGFCLKKRLTARNVKLKAYFAFLSLNLREKISRKSLFYGNWPLYPRFARKAA